MYETNLDDVLRSILANQKGPPSNNRNASEDPRQLNHSFANRRDNAVDGDETDTLAEPSGANEDMAEKSADEAVLVGSAGRSIKRKALIGIAAAATVACVLLLASSIAFSTDRQLAVTPQIDGLHFASFRIGDPSNVMTSNEAANLIDWPQSNRELSAGLRIGMIDGGVNVDHPALAGQNIQARDFRVSRSLPAPMDHGTGVAAILVGNSQSAEFRGLLPNAALFAANIFSEAANGRVIGHPAAFMAAVEWMIEMDVSVINVSLTGRENAIVALAVQKALDHGILVVAAAGNNRGVHGRDFPGAYDGVLAVTAVDANLNIYRHASIGDHVDFAAPGVSLQMASNSGSHVLSGTSFAAPFLTAAVAVADAAGGQADADAMRRTFAADSRDLGQRGTDHTFGRGLIDCDNINLQTAQIARRASSAPAGPRHVGLN